MRPISGGSDPYRDYLPPSRRDPAAAARASTVRRAVPADAGPSAPDLELSVRLFADGGSITVKRHTVAESDGTRRTVGIDAVVR